MATGIRKLYYSISEVSKLTGLKQHVLRFWEGEFDRLQPKKNRAGNRAYTEADIDVVRRIKRLLKDEKYTIEGARHALAQELRGDVEPTRTSREELVELRAFLSDVLRRIEPKG